MTADQVKKLTPSDRSLDEFLECTGGKPSATVVNLFLGAYRQRLVELLEQGQAAAGLCVQTDCRREVKRLGDHTFRRCPEHMTGRLRELGRK